jgi:uncharacterized membrane protein (DUF373 family)
MNEQNIIDKSIYNKNLKTNQEKIAFWKFLMYGTKAEVHINSIQALLYWVSIMELFLFALGLALFISSPNNFAIFWAFITHVVRAILGLILLKRLPGTHLVIEELKEYEDSTIQDVENNILQLYKNMLSNNEKSIGRILLWYFIFTIIDIIMDNIVFFYLQQKWSNATYGLQNFFALILIVANFCKILLNYLIFYFFSVQWCLFLFIWKSKI